ncbi:MAG: glycosyltransferase family 4 protein, partial [Gammaproteobacteria bacterium]
MRVLHVVPTAGPGGVQTHVRHLANGLRERGISVMAAVGTTGALVEQLGADGIDARVVPMRRRTDFRAIVSLHKLLREWKADLVHTHSPLGGILGRHAALWARIPTVYTLHGLGILDELRLASSQWHRLKLTTYRWHERWLNGQTNAVLAPAPALAEIAVGMRHVDRRQLKVIPHGIPLPPQPSTNGRRPIVAFVGRLHPEKGVDDLIAAFATVRQQVSDAILRIVGDGPARADVQRQVEALGLRKAVTFTGITQDVGAALEGVTCVALPSHAEGLSYTLLEAMAKGIPCVATAVGGTPDLIENGRTGTLIRPGDYRALSDAIVRLMNNPVHSRKMGEEARQTILNRFSPEHMVSSTID